MNDCSLLTLAAEGYLIGVAAAIVPGPDLLLVTRSSITAGRIAGLLCTAGVGCGLIFYASLTLVASSAIAGAPPSLLMAIRVVGACYLAWIGWQMITAKNSSLDLSGEGPVLVGRTRDWQFFRQGLITALGNPKLLLFLVAIVSQVLATRNDVDSRVATLIGIICGPLSVFTSASLAGGLFHRRMTPSWISRIDRFSGAVLIGFAVVGLFVINK